MNVKKIAEITGGILEGNGETEINGVAALETAREGEISFVETTEKSFQTNASCLFVSENFVSENITIIRVKNPKLAFAKIAAKLHPIEFSVKENHPTAVIAENANVRADYIGAFVSIGENSYIGEGTQIHDGVKIGNNVNIGKFTIIYPNCVIYDNVSIGDDCVIHSGTIIGADGFGYVRDGAKGYVKFPQIGTVDIEDDVEIGANSCIDRGALGETRIGEGTKIDNLVQIAHNVQIGKRCRHRRANRNFGKHDYRRRLRHRRTSRDGRPRDCQKRRNYRLASRSFAGQNRPRRSLVGNARPTAR